MAKKEESNYMSSAEIKENIRKAKGNPNKNIHAKRKNSNYHPTETKQVKDNTPKLEPLPTSVKITLFVIFALLLVALVMNFFVMKDNEVVTYISAVYLGIVALVLYGLRNYTYMRDPRKRDSSGSVILSWMLVIVGVMYVLTGATSLFKYFF